MNRLLILVRHSLPEIQKDLPAREWRLSEEGRERAGRLAGSLTAYRPQQLASSPEPKAVETAGILGNRLALPVQVIEDLREHERSKVDYLSRPALDALVRRFFDEPNRLVFGSETADEAYQRFSGAVHSMLAESHNDRIAIVSHGTVICLFVSRLTGQPAFQIWSGLGLPGLIVLDMETKSMIAFENHYN